MKNKGKTTYKGVRDEKMRVVEKEFGLYEKPKKRKR